MISCRNLGKASRRLRGSRNKYKNKNVKLIKEITYFCFNCRIYSSTETKASTFLPRRTTMSGWLVYDTVKTVRIEDRLKKTLGALLQSPPRREGHNLITTLFHGRDRKLSALYYALVLGALAYTASTIVYHKVRARPPHLVAS
jgi:hypothetical protein